MAMYGWHSAEFYHLHHIKFMLPWKRPFFRHGILKMLIEICEWRFLFSSFFFVWWENVLFDVGYSIRACCILNKWWIVLPVLTFGFLLFERSLRNFAKRPSMVRYGHVPTNILLQNNALFQSLPAVYSLSYCTSFKYISVLKIWVTSVSVMLWSV